MLLPLLLTRPPSPRWTPLHLAGLRLWLAADRITGLSDGDPVSSWSDLSGNARHATQDTLGLRPSYQTNILNGKPVVRGDGLTEFLTATGALTSNVLVAVVVINRSSTAGDYLAETQAGGDRRFHYYGGTVFKRWSNGPSADLAVDEAAIMVHGVSGSDESLYKNGTSAGTGNSAPDLTSADLNLFSAGVLFPKQCDLAEVIVAGYAANHLTLRRYLSNKWGIALT